MADSTELPSGSELARRCQLLRDTLPTEVLSLDQQLAECDDLIREIDCAVDHGQLRDGEAIRLLKLVYQYRYALSRTPPGTSAAAVARPL